MFKDFMTDRVTLVKKDGRRFEGLPASVQSGLIMTEDPRIPIEDGDNFVRQLPSGVTEMFVVLDAGFNQAFHGIAAHYQSKVEKTTARKAVSGNHIVYNLIGSNARVNINSSDSSTNVVNVESHQLFDNLQQTVGHAVQNDDLRRELLKCIDEMRASAGTPSFGTRYKDFISLAADHLSLVAPFLPALTQLLC